MNKKNKNILTIILIIFSMVLLFKILFIVMSLSETSSACSSITDKIVFGDVEKGSYQDMLRNDLLVLCYAHEDREKTNLINTTFMLVISILMIFLSLNEENMIKKKK